jgi:cytochrome oxidase Cu insertion factor (SCO1/SenC/PrrC family)
VRKRIILLIAIGVVVLLTPSVRGGNLSPPEGDYSSCGVQKFEKKKAPSFSLKGLNRHRIALKDLEGKPIILAF